MKSRLAYFTYVLLLVFAALAALEAFARHRERASGFVHGTEYPWMSGFADVYTLDPEFGFRPVLGSGAYTADGVLRNAYSRAKRPGVRRIFFVGDSVTARGRLVEALRSRYGEERYEYWNAGVESFNTAQEVRFYLRYNRAIDPDEVVLTFTPNDFHVTPIAFLDEQKRLVVYSPSRRVSMNRLARALYRSSAVYRQALARLLDDRRNEALLVGDVDRALGELQAETLSRGARLTVLVHPILRPESDWLPGERAVRETVLGMLDRRGIRHFDLSEPLRAGAVPAGALSTSDPIHPNREAAETFADFLLEKELLGD